MEPYRIEALGFEIRLRNEDGIRLIPVYAEETYIK